MFYPANIEEKIGFDTVRRMLQEACRAAGSRRQAAEMLPMTDYDTVTRLLGETDEMMKLLQSGTPMPSDEIDTLDEAMTALRVTGMRLGLEDVRRLRHVLQTISDVAAYFAAVKGEDHPLDNLQPTVDRLIPLPHVQRAIARVIDIHGEVMDTASPELADIRRELRRAAGSVMAAMRRVMSRCREEGTIEAATTPTMRDGRLVIPVAPMHKRRISGIVHDESASGKTVFIEPAEVVEANNRIRELHIDEQHEINRILSELTDNMRPDAPQIEASYGVLTELDFIRARGSVGIAMQAEMPRLQREPALEFYRARHPGLELSLARQGRSMVPLDIALIPGSRILVISGPNAGGKSVCLKTAGVVQYMLQCGLMPTVASNSVCTVFEDMFVNIGDDQSLDDDLSTYSSHLRAMKMTVTRGGARSMILIDEFGSGTEPQIGGAIAQALLKEMNHKKMWGVVTTHYRNLKLMAEDTPGLVNGSMQYDRQHMKPLFKLTVGNAGSSFAIEIARNTGLPAHIIADAEEIAGSDYVNMEKYLLDIARDRRYWENKRENIRQKEKKLDQLAVKYEEDVERLRDKRQEIISAARDEARRILEGSNAAIERTIMEIRSSQAEKARTMEMRRQLETEKQKFLGDDQSTGEESVHPLLKQRQGKKTRKKDKNATPAPKSVEAPIAVGDNVKLDGSGQPGEVLEINGNNAVVAFGMLKTTVALARLKRTMATARKAVQDKTTFVSSSTMDRMRDRQLQFKPEIDVRGMRADEALQAVTYFIDDAIQFDQKRVRILHGTGTGALRQAIRDYLRGVAGVRSFADEDVRFGGAGITVVNFD